MMDYFEGHAGGIEDVKETFDLFSDILQKVFIPKLILPELEPIRNIFLDEPLNILESLRQALFEINEIANIQAVEDMMHKLRDGLANLADEKGVLLVSDESKFQISTRNIEATLLECRIIRSLYVCTEKLAALLTFKRAQIALLK